MPDREPTATLTKLSLYPTDAPRTYRVTLITAGRVKNRDQSLADWEITPDAIMHAAPLADGRAVFIDHAGTTSHPEPPSIRNLVGVTTNVKFDPHRLALDGTIRLYDRDDTHWVQQLLDQITADQASDRPTPDIGLSMVFFGLFVKMSNGATYGVVPFVNKKALGSVAGIVGAGGNAGAVAAGFLFRSESLTMQAGLFYLGLCVVIASLFVFFIRFSPETIEQEKRAFQEAQAQKTAAVGS
jgi:hypothetical protein